MSATAVSRKEVNDVDETSNGAKKGPGRLVPAVWTQEAVRGLGMTTDIETAAAILGIGRTKAYELARAGVFPVKVIRIGRRYLVPIPAILQLLDAG